MSACVPSAAKKASKNPQHKTESELQEEMDYKSNGSTKPPYSYATLICMAMKANKNKMTLNSIYKWIRENFLYYQHADPSWQVGCSSLTGSLAHLLTCSLTHSLTHRLRFL